MLSSNLLKTIIITFVLLVSTFTVMAEGMLQPFLPGSYAQILNQHKQKPFVLVLWSVDCPPCHKELEMLGKLQTSDKQLNIILVSTDSEVDSDEVNANLAKYNVDKLESWVFRGASDQSLRYEIDPRWYGELPRSYFFKPTGEKQAVSGVLSKQKILGWLNL